MPSRDEVLPSGSSSSINRNDDIARRVDVQVRLALAQEKANQLSQEMLQRDRKQREEQIKVKELIPVMNIPVDCTHEVCPELEQTTMEQLSVRGVCHELHSGN